MREGQDPRHFLILFRILTSSFITARSRKRPGLFLYYSISFLFQNRYCN
nr:MAG TPA: hypothetical protein [Caudoviricetes sp.]